MLAESKVDAKKSFKKFKLNYLMHGETEVWNGVLQ